MKKWCVTLLMLLLCVPALALGESGEIADAHVPQKVMYITFDDGPKADTPELLALLEELDVPATFFLMGACVKMYPEHAKMIYEAGHPIGCHSMGHKYSYLKENVNHIGLDLRQFTRMMRELVGEEFETDLFRFPGGSSSYSSYSRRYVAEQGYAWFDWDAMTGDTLPEMNAEKIVEHALKESGDKEVVILLAHEGKQKTRDALVEIVKHYRALGYEFRTLSTDPEERTILERCSAKIRWPRDEKTAQ